MTRRTRALVLGLVAAAACTEAVDAETTSDGTSTAGTSEGAGSSSSPGSTTDTVTEADTSSTGPALVDVPASGIAVDFVEVNQGVSVRVGENGAGVGPGDRTAPIVAGRLALVRGFYTLADDWQPRAIEGRLVLRHDDGTIETLVDDKTIAEEAFAGSLDRTFFWGVEAETIQPGLEFRVELWEGEPGLASDEAPPQLPESGAFAPIGVESSDLLMRALIVPVEYDDGSGCATTPDVSAETMQLYEDLMFMMNPLDRIEIEVRAPIEWNTPLESFAELNFALSDLRFEDGAAPDVYYYGIIDVCAGDVDGFGGMAYDIPADPTAMDGAYKRVASGLALANNPEFSAETFVHEIGHLQGRRHVTCNGEEAGPDPSYPIPGGDVGEWGFGVVDFQLRHPTFYKDYMTYCHPVWVSTYGWNKAVTVIAALTSWGVAAPPPTPSRVLAGVVLPSGRELWHVVPGVAPHAGEPDATLELDIDGTRVVVPAFTGTVPDAPDHATFVAPLPVPFTTIDALARVQRSERRPIDRSRVRVATVH